MDREAARLQLVFSVAAPAECQRPTSEACGPVGLKVRWRGNPFGMTPAGPLKRYGQLVDKDSV
jgi:hypothetical protein